MKILILSLIFLYLVNPLSALSAEQADCPKWDRRSPYGDYSKGKKWGWYGAKKKVKDVKEAENIIKEIFPNDARIANIKERRFFFEAEIRDGKDNLIDIVIIDKRTGRIRSIY